MGRRAKVWERKDRPGWFATVGGRQRFLAAAREEAERLFHLLKAGGGKKDMAVSDLVTLFMAELKAKPNTVRTYELFFRTFVQSVGKRKLAGAVTPLEIDHWLRPSWNPSTRRSAVTAIITLFHFGHKKGLTEPNLEVTAMKRLRMGTRRPLPPAKVREVLDKVNPQLRAFLTALLETGARPGELMRARAEEYAGGVITLEEHKTAERTGKPRQIYLNSRIRQLAEELIGGRKSGIIFRNTRGGRWTNYSVSIAIRRTGVDACAYQFRHNFASTAINAGMDRVWVAKLLGHSSPQTLFRHYFEEDTAAMFRAAEEATKGVSK